MLSTKNKNNNSSVFANTATFDNVSINGGITNASLTSSLNKISRTINTISGKISTISGGLNNLQTYIGINTISGDINLNCNNINYNNLNMIKPQTQYTNNIAFQQFINQLL